MLPQPLLKVKETKKETSSMNLTALVKRFSHSSRSDRGLVSGPENEPGAGENEEDFDYLENECLGGESSVRFVGPRTPVMMSQSGRE